MSDKMAGGFQEGYDAFSAGKLQADCPYAKDSPEAHSWQWGWFAARRHSRGIYGSRGKAAARKSGRKTS